MMNDGIINLMQGFYIVLYAALLHIAWAVALLFSDLPQMATPIAPLFRLSLNHSGLLSFILLAVSAGALGAHWRWGDRSFLTALALLPQQALLSGSAWESGMAVLNGAYSDGVDRSRVFIFCDQWPNMLAVILHSVYLLIVFVKTIPMHRKNASS